MLRTSQNRPARKFGPGYFIREQMDLRMWTQQDLAEITGFTQKHISEMLNDKIPVSFEMARILGEVFNNSATYWLNIDQAYRLWLQQTPSEKEKAADIRAMIYERMPVKDMQKKGWLKKTTTLDGLKKAVLEFWGKTKLDFSDIDQTLLPYLTRKSEAFDAFNASYALTWYQKARQTAEQLSVPTYNREALEQLTNEMHGYTQNEQGVADFLEKLTSAGVKFFVLPHLEKTYLDGAAFFSGNNPVVVYTGRYKRLDHFWFSLAHELAHVLLHLNDETPFVLDNLEENTRSVMENEANALAATMLKHAEIYSALQHDLHYLSTSKVEECAATYKVHPAIVIGKLAHEGKVHYRNLQLYNINALNLIPERFHH